MVLDNFDNKSDIGNRPLDEGWWNSILTDEEKYQLDPIVEGNNRISPLSNERNNWITLEEVFKNDAILTLRVVGYNRGGLLVQGDGVQGFVPISHLSDVPCTVSDDERKTILGDYVNNEIEVKIIEFVPREERIVFS